MRHTVYLFVALSSIVLSQGLAWTAQLDEVTVERGVKAAMRDGVVLRADIYRPKQQGRFPVLLQRTPYNKSGGAGFGYRAAASGYVVVIQDVRGRYTSDGEWRPFQHESQDGYDTVEWVASLPYSNGKVGMFGGSYVGATQMLTAITHPPHLAGICPVVTASNYHNGWTYQGGAFEQWFNESWTSGLAQDTLNRLIEKDTNAMGGVWKLPLAGYPLFNSEGRSPKVDSPNELAPYFLDWLAHPNYDDYWKRWSIEEHYPDIKVPALTIAAWYDIFQGGSLRNYQGIRTKGGSEEARRGQRLLVTIGGHAGSGRKIGDVDFGPAAAQYDEDDVTLQWYDYLFKGIENQFGKKPVKIFVMGTNQWRDEDDWPLKQARETKYFLHSSTAANSLRGDGSLSMEIPHSEPPDHYVYDPSNPVPTIGGPLCCDGQHLAAGPRDQRPDESREDVLLYSTEPFSKAVEVTGPVSVDLYAKSSAVDTDFTAKLVDVW
ncbi:MAG: CocE/NonD family hydrolase, partial [Bryobacteraceae bacterium]